MTQALPCGTWPSPLSPELTASAAVALSFAGVADGQLVWVEGRPAERGRCVLMTRAADGSVREVLGPDTNVRTRVHEYGGFPWTVVGSQLVFSSFADQRLYLRSADGVVSALTPPGCRYADGQGTPDGRHMVAVLEDHLVEGEPRNCVVLLDTAEPGNAGRVLFANSDFVAWPRLNREGTRLALVAWNHPAMPWDDTQLLVIDLEQNNQDGYPASATLVAGGPGESVLDPQWADDGSLYFLSDRTGWWNLYCWRDGSTQAVAPMDAEVGGPLWQLGMRSYLLTGDGRVLLRVGRGTVETLELHDLQTGTLTPLRLPFVAFGALGLLDADTVYALASPLDEPPSLVTIDLRTGTHTVVRRSGDAPIEPAAVSRPRAIEFPTEPGPDGAERSAHAWFYPPCLPDVEMLPGEAPPLIVMLHGGPSSHAGPAFKVGVQFWTTRGFAVVDVNYGGSSGFGRAYRNRLRGQWGIVDLQDAVAAVNHLVATGRVDGQRVAIRGGSAGGFTVLSALAFTTRFAAGINYYGVADLETLAADTHKFESRYLDSLVAPLPAGRDIYRARSPVHHMAACRAALITFQGSDDQAVPPQQSRDIVAAARSAGCPVAYLEFEGEGHGFRQAANIVRALQCEIAFLGRVFGYQPVGGEAALHIDNAVALRPAPQAQNTHPAP